MKVIFRFSFGISLCFTLLGLLACVPTNGARSSPSGATGVSALAVSTVDQTATIAFEIIEAALSATPIPPTRGSDMGASAPDTDAAKTVEAQNVAAAVAATLTAQPAATPTPDLAVTQTTEAQRVATMIAATLTAQPTTTPDQAATQTGQSSNSATTMSPPESLTPSSLERIRFPSGSTIYTFSTQLTPGLAKGYLLRMLAGQHLFVVSATTSRFAVLDPDHVELTPFSTSTGQIVFPLTKTGDYTLLIAGDGRATISIDVPPLPEQIQFTLGSTSTMFTIHLTQSASRAYRLWVAGGQQIFVKVDQPVELLAFAPAGNELISNQRDLFQWRFPTTQTGDHSIFLKGAGDVTITIIIPPL